jgi:hypothetical protein
LGKGLFGIKKTMGGTFSESKGHFITGNGSENQEEGPKNSHNHKKFTKISHNHKNGADLEGGYSFFFHFWGSF